MFNLARYGVGLSKLNKNFTAYWNTGFLPNLLCQCICALSGRFNWYRFAWLLRQYGSVYCRLYYMHFLAGRTMNTFLKCQQLDLVEHYVNTVISGFKVFMHWRLAANRTTVVEGCFLISTACSHQLFLFCRLLNKSVIRFNDFNVFFW